MKKKTEKRIIIVDENNNNIDIGEKTEVHKKGILHRAFSIFVFNSNGELMLQQRAAEKYHSGGLWSNTCCSHPAPGADLESEAHKRLQEEMGFDCTLEEIFSFKYRIRFEKNLFEHEWDHAFFGFHNDEPVINRDEVEDWKWINLKKLEANIKTDPQLYTYWLKEALPGVLKRR